MAGRQTSGWSEDLRGLIEEAGGQRAGERDLTELHRALTGYFFGLLMQRESDYHSRMIAEQIHLKPTPFWEELLGWLLENHDLIYSVSLWELCKGFRRQLKKPGRLILVAVSDSRGWRFKWIRVVPASSLWEFAQGRRFMKLVFHAPTVQVGGS